MSAPTCIHGTKLLLKSISLGGKKYGLEKIKSTESMSTKVGHWGLWHSTELIESIETHHGHSILPPKPQEVREVGWSFWRLIMLSMS